MSNYISEDFPLPRAKYEKVNFNHQKIPEKTRKNLSNFYNNELPDLFKLDTMVENKNGYNNPYLNEVIKLDRSEEFKKMNFNRKQIKIIDFIKSKREYSQNPDILKYIRSDFDIEMQNKRERVLKEKDEKIPKYKYTLTEENEPKKGLYIETLKKLNQLTPKLNIIHKRDIIKENVIPISKSVNVSIHDLEKVKSLNCEIEPMKSSYIANKNDFKISEAEKFNINDRYFFFDRKPLIEYNPIKDKEEVKNRPPLMNNKWDAFNENFFMLINKENGYQRKGGLFTEFSNKNIRNINFQKENDKENRLILEKKGLIKELNKISQKPSVSEKKNIVKTVNDSNIKQMPESLK